VFLFLAHQCESTARTARPRTNQFFYRNNNHAASNRCHCSLRLSNQHLRQSATWSCRRLSSHSIEIENWRPRTFAHSTSTDVRLQPDSPSPRSTTPDRPQRHQELNERRSAFSIT